ncbi:glycosyltransferase family 4 protein [Fictibacillus barbaricus]|uniref:Glycosyltransferase family 4 protein n=1 Tax=Fictibacillus barbaricus TaxID=182136 RepID=A0ABS2ZE77_9BACL|nr:glycosyltransferase family 1 protein [Fictibacillus barbaricus]MBN3544901.1 glycosyltransferase family 4 protein [Fictibacillus barbaricus]GGB63224.1 glycosyl transferase [Fictibacillus barbaricus]
MRIGVNLLNLQQDRYGGVEQYVVHLISRILKIDNRVELFLFLTKPSRDLFPDYQERLKKIMIKEYNIHKVIYPLIAQCQLDLWFSPLHRSYLPDIPVPSITTIHDVLHTAYPQFVPGDFQENNSYYEQFASSFDAVLTVSEFSRNAIAKNIGIPKVKIHAIYPDAPLAFQYFSRYNQRERIKKKYALEEGYAIYPASYNPHKNHISLLKALVSLRDNYNKRLKLVLTGYASKENRVHQSVLNFLKEHKLETQVNVLGYVPPEDMPSLYANALCLVFPSLYEGFGIPLVEAMKTQCPIVCSNRGSIPEVVGDAGLQFNPEDPEDIALKMLDMLDPRTRENFIKKGNMRSKRFSWENCAKETLNVFKQVVKRNEK